VFYKVPVAIKWKSHIYIFVTIFFRDTRARLELYLKRIYTIFVVSEKISSLPVVV